MDADLVDILEAQPDLQEIYAEAEKCSGSIRPFESVKIFLVTEIHVKDKDGKWNDIWSGTWRNDRVYIKRGMSDYWTVWMLKHEFVHHVKQLSHPEVDETMKACGVHYEMETP